MLHAGAHQPARLDAALLATYAATKAFNTVLAEGLWEELGHHGVDVLACIAGAVATPNYERSKPRGSGGTMTAAAVAEAALSALGGGPSVIPGGRNKLGAFLFQRLLPRRVAVRTMAGITRRMYTR